MKRPRFRRFEARCYRFWGEAGGTLARVALALFFIWEAASTLGPRASIAGGPLDVSAQALSIMSVGHVTYQVAPKLLGALDLALAILILGFAASRLATIAVALRMVIAALPLGMLRDDLFAAFPLRPSAAGWGALATAALCGSAWLTVTRERWRKLEALETTSLVLAETPEQIKARVRRWKRFAAVFVPLALAVALSMPTVWPRYLKWFHARQEAATLGEKLSGKLVKKSMPPSLILGGRKITTWVYLPPGYDTSSERYPVIYVMHGMPGEVRDCFVKGRVQDAAETLISSRQIRPLIIVGWDGQGPAGPGDVTNFLDRPDYKMESFMEQELVPYIDRTYRTVADPRFRSLDGVSAGGYAAPNLVLKHPEIWKIGASHTGFFSPEDDAENMTAILGPRSSNAALWDANNPTKTVFQRGPEDGIHMYLDLGQGDDLLPEFKRFAISLKARKIDTQARIYPGRHTWEYWSEHFLDSFRFADRNFPPAPL